MTAIIDYDAGNIKSVQNACRLLGKKTILTRDRETILSADRVILPGVGAFGDAMERIRDYQLEEVIREVIEKGTPFLGICLGLQLIFEESEESPGVKGLSLLPGKICRFPDKGLKIPQIGWNSVSYPVTSPLFEGVPTDSYFYFVHSYHIPADNPAVIGAAEYGIPFGAAIQKENLFACQFHPEKSSKVGLKLLQNFLEM